VGYPAFFLRLRQYHGRISHHTRLRLPRGRPALCIHRGWRGASVNKHVRVHEREQPLQRPDP
ncbi:unnamed protein product, partial [Amoebophrya sp. A120]